MKKPRHTNVPAVYLLIVKDKKVLLLRRHNTGYQDGNFGLVSGHVEEGETFIQGAIREGVEEVGISIRPKDLKVVHLMHRNSEQNEQNERVDVFLAVEKWEGEIKNMEPHLHDKMDWFDLDQLPKNIMPYVGYALDQIAEKKFYSEYGWEK